MQVRRRLLYLLVHNIIIMVVTTLSFLFLLLIASSTAYCPPNCLFCLQQPLCSACTQGFILTVNATCLLQTVPNCRIQLNSSACAICEPTFMVSGTQCIKDNYGCVLRYLNGTCKFCSFGTKLNGESCTGVLNCQNTLPSGACSQCSAGFSLSGGVCVDSRPACASKVNGICTKCFPKFILNGFSCISDIFVPPGCSLFDFTKGRCFICNEGYEIYLKFCQRLDEIPFTTSSAILVRNSLRMPQDFLDGNTPQPTNNRGFLKSESIVQDFLDISIKVSVGQGQTANNDNCWQRNNNGNCVFCYQGYNLVNQVCVKSAPICLQFDSSGRLCTNCIPQLTLSQGNCRDINCAVPIFSRCTKCLNNFSPNSQGICINSNCIALSQGLCVRCAQGFNLSSANSCITSTSATSTAKNSPSLTAVPTTPSIAGCDQVKNGVCTICSANYFQNGKGGCKRVIIGCLQMDGVELNCLQCMSIYKKTPDGGCIYQESLSPVPLNTNANVQTNSKSTSTSASSITSPPPSTPSTPVSNQIEDNCLVRNSGSCAICKPRFILNLFNFSCQAVPKECLTFNPTNGKCLSCAQGFNLFSIWCLGKMTQPDPNCMIYDINNYCSTCQPQYYQSQGRCVPVNSQCKSLNIIGGDCTACYSGYVVFNGDCVLLSKQPGCMQYDFQSNCIKCSQRYYLQAFICVPVSPLCNNFHSQNGSCIDCVTGYGISTITNSCEVVKSLPPNCQTADQVGNCLTCLPRFFFNASNSCTLANPLCSKFVSIGGKCLSCLTGYNLLPDASCVQSNLSTGCKSATSSGLCTGCINQYVLTAMGGCLYKDPNCVNYDQGGSCTKCVSLYYNNHGKCIKQTLKSKDPNCNINDLMNYCLFCNAGYYISLGNCILADQLCRTFDTSNGNCLTCYSGYRLYQNQCFLDNPIFNCKQFSGSICVVCQTGYSVQSDGSCAKN